MIKYVDEVLVCDDGSKDLTGRFAEGMGAELMVHERNMGYGAALQSLFSESLRLEADILAKIDADGQHTPAEIPSFIERIDKGGCVLYGAKVRYSVYCSIFLGYDFL